MSGAAPQAPALGSVDDVDALLSAGRYIAGRELATAVFLALTMRRPLLLEGETGVGKTEIASVLAGQLGRTLIRLQCYEGLDFASAACEWNFPRQMLEIRRRERGGELADDALFTAEFLLERPLLRALRPQPGGAPVLLIDELDRADEPFEAFLLEFLADYQLTIPELGTLRADEPPIVIITSNRTRDVHDALRRRCLFHWVDYPALETERRIVALKAPGVAAELQKQVTAFVQALRRENLYKAPGTAETIDWAQALAALDARRLTAPAVRSTLGALLKYPDDIARVSAETLDRLLADTASAA